MELSTRGISAANTRLFDIDSSVRIRNRTAASGLGRSEALANWRRLARVLSGIANNSLRNPRS